MSLGITCVVRHSLLNLLGPETIVSSQQSSKGQSMPLCICICYFAFVSVGHVYDQGQPKQIIFMLVIHKTLRQLELAILCLPGSARCRNLHDSGFT